MPSHFLPQCLALWHIPQRPQVIFIEPQMGEFVSFGWCFNERSPFFFYRQKSATFSLGFQRPIRRICPKSVRGFRRIRSANIRPLAGLP
jgi:hypothetical protein